MKVYCTRPRQLSEPAHWTDAPIDAVLGRCPVCGMPLGLGNGRYVPIAELGLGGFGRTFLAEDLKFGRTQRVIKQFRTDLLLLPGQLAKAQEAFKREARILDQLKHNQIPRVYESFDLVVPGDSRFNGDLPVQTYYYFVQEYIDGVDLQKWMVAGERFDEGMVRELLGQMLGVLDYIHTLPQPVIHRDIKPSNMIRRSDGLYHLVDFGAVKQVMVMVVAESGLSPVPTNFVTPGFSPPEQGTGAIDQSVDLYALGKTCIYLLTGTSAGLEQAPIGENLANVLRLMTASQPSERYRSAKAVQQALQTLTKSLTKSLTEPEQQTIQPIATTPQSRPAKQSRSVKQAQLARMGGRSWPWRYWLAGLGAIGAMVGFNYLSKNPSSRSGMGAPAVCGSTISEAPSSLPEQPDEIMDVQAVPNQSQVRYGGSTTWIPLKDGFNGIISTHFRYFQLKWELPADGGRQYSEEGIQRLINGELDFAVSSKRLNQELRCQAEKQGVKLKHFLVAKGATAIVVHPSMKIAGMTETQFTRVKEGQIKNWRELGGPDQAIQFYMTDPSYLGNNSTAKLNLVSNTEATIKKVMADKFGITIVPAATAAENCNIRVLPMRNDRGELVSPYKSTVSSEDCRFNGISKINYEVIENDRYPLQAKLTVVVRTDRPEAGEAYAKMLLTKKAQNYMRQLGFGAVK